MLVGPSRTREAHRTSLGGIMTTALRIHCRTVCVILACLAFGSDALAAEPGGIKIQGLLGPSASGPMRDTSARCEMGDAAVCWSLANSFFRFAEISAPRGTCALRSCDDPAAAYNELGCAITRHACYGGVTKACVTASKDCPDGRGQSLLASMTSTGEPVRLDGPETRMVESQREAATRPQASLPPPATSRMVESRREAAPRPEAVLPAPATSRAENSTRASRQSQARWTQARPPAPTAATYGEQGLAVVVAWSDSATGPEPLDAQLVSAVVAQGFRVVDRPRRIAPALFLQQERPDCDPWYLRELILALDAELGVCASVRQGQLNLTAASLRRDVTRYTTLIVANDLQVVDEQLAAISLPEIVHPSPSVSVVADLKAAYDAFPTVTVELPVTERLSLAVRGGYQDTDDEPTPYLMVGLQARLYFNRYQDGLFLGLHTDWASASYADELQEQSFNIVTTGLSAGYRLDLPFHISVTPKVEGLLVNQHTMTDTVVSVGKTSAWADAEADGRATLEVGFKF
jgi:hypothetical protein